MGAIHRQQYIDGTTGEKKVREMLFDVEMMRPDDSSSISSSMYLKVEKFIEPHHGNHQSFQTVYIDPTELISSLIDGRRTFSPLGCNRTRIKSISKDNVTFYVEDNSKNGLNAKVGDPVVFMSDLDGNNISYSKVKSIHSNAIIVENIMPPYFRGAIIENLSNRWHKDNDFVGAKSQLEKPIEPSVIVERSPTGILVKIGKPMSLGNTKFYDVYVRDGAFDKLEFHWVPDAENIPTDTNSVLINTYNGGEPAGGGKLTEEKVYVAIVSKDKIGFVSVNESDIKLFYI